MKATVYCKPTAQCVYNFYLCSDEGKFFLFSQRYRKGVQKYFSRGVYLDAARDFSRSNRDSAIVKTMNKLPMYIKFIEKEYGVTILEKPKRSNQNISQINIYVRKEIK